MDFKLFYISLQNSGHINESSRSPHCIRDKPFSFSYPPRFARLGYENSKGLSRMQFGARELSNSIHYLSILLTPLPYISLFMNQKTYKTTWVYAHLVEIIQLIKQMTDHSKGLLMQVLYKHVKLLNNNLSENHLCKSLCINVTMFRVSLIAVSVSGEWGRNNECLAVDPARSLHHGVDDDDEHDLVHGETVPLVQTTWTTDGEFFLWMQLFWYFYV